MQKKILQTIMDKIFWDFLILHQFFISPQVKRSVIISNKHGICELPHELPSDRSFPVSRYFTWKLELAPYFVHDCRRHFWRPWKLNWMEVKHLFKKVFFSPWTCSPVRKLFKNILLLLYIFQNTTPPKKLICSIAVVCIAVQYCPCV